MEERIVGTLLEFFPSVQAIYLFGSFGTEFERPGSDADIALLLPAGGEAPEMEDCREALERMLRRPVDLVDLRRSSTVFQFEVVRTGRRIFAGDGSAVDLFEMLAISFYQKLNEERAGILASVLERGRVLL